MYGGSVSSVAFHEPGIDADTFSPGLLVVNHPLRVEWEARPLVSRKLDLHPVQQISHHGFLQPKFAEIYLYQPRGRVSKDDGFPLIRSHVRQLPTPESAAEGSQSRR
jgi:hypothetical protein